MRVLVTGGAGYIGSIVSEELVNQGHQVVVYDNLYTGHQKAVVEGAHFVRGDLMEGDLLRETLSVHATETVIHMAADALVGDSMLNPAKFFRNNVTAGLSLLDAMNDCGIRRIVFSSTAAVYGEPERLPIEETDPTNPKNPYGESKLAFERVLHWYEKAYGFRYVALRYFNAAGASKKYGEAHDRETHLIPLILKAAADNRPAAVFGADYATRDGTCLRDYVHVIDIARAHILALGILGQRSTVYNIGCGNNGYTVREVIETAREVTGKPIPERVVSRRLGDPAVLVAGNEKIKRELAWSPTMQDLHEIIASAWEWMLQHPNGY
ncbi:MAG TPA: UDP-glucose 4-epimerase GalE [Blastocatellia bacterium]|nr:UDP-glucose 4-epimerase GalE [Blastocatellia bacterium]